LKFFKNFSFLKKYLKNFLGRSQVPKVKRDEKGTSFTYENYQKETRCKNSSKKKTLTFVKSFINFLVLNFVIVYKEKVKVFDDIVQFPLEYQ
jgi:hypothetical protein